MENVKDNVKVNVNYQYFELPIEISPHIPTFLNFICLQTTGVMSDVDYTTIKTVNEKVAVDYNTSPVYEPAITTFQVILIKYICIYIGKQNKMMYFNKH